METTQEIVDINHLVSETITFLENEAHFRDIQIQTEYEETLPKVSTDPTSFSKFS